MSFGTNLQFLRKMRNSMTQEALAEKLGVSRQTVSKWEMDAAFPEMEKAMALKALFSCTLDELFASDLGKADDIYSRLRVETVPALCYQRYAVVSAEPEDDAINHLKAAAKAAGIDAPDIIGWDFPVLSQEQINVYNMHGYMAAIILHDERSIKALDVLTQKEARYAAITIEEPFTSPFTTIPNGYRTLMRYMETNGIAHKEAPDRIACYEKTYEHKGKTYMDVFISACD